MRPSRMNDFQQRFGRLRRTSTFRDQRFDKWCEATLGIVGVGMLGCRLAVEAVLSGARVSTYDFDVGKRENLGTQFVRQGTAKVESAVAACDAVCPGRAAGHSCDVRHLGVGELAELDVLVDCSDDPALAVPLTRLSNGLGIPLLRLALDGSGESEVGRVLCSHGGAGYSCQVCPYDFQDLFRPTRRTPCPGQPDSGRPPTIAGGALAAAIAGCGLLQAQRLVTGNDLELVVDQEILLDLSRWKLLAIQRQRSQRCLSGHVRWQLTRIERSADELTFPDLFAEAEQHLGDGRIALEPYGHALCVEAVCSCGGREEVVAARWARPPDCTACGETMSWVEQTQYSQISKADVQRLGITGSPLGELGLPRAGAMIVARMAGKRPLRMVLDCQAPSSERPVSVAGARREE